MRDMFRLASPAGDRSGFKKRRRPGRP